MRTSALPTITRLTGKGTIAILLVVGAATNFFGIDNRQALSGQTAPAGVLAEA